ncbi:MAG TPA: CZB domain-containing protein [Bryobacteraceae bacterium]|nr:CZB domain-containing protein [Bryobacteraceae bacterium]
MDFDSAIKAHANWMLRLFGYCKGTSQEKLDAGTIQKDNVCDLGKWLHGDGRKFAADPEFKTLVETHAAFHKSAASVVVLVDRGQRPEAEKLLSSADSEYMRRSTQVVGLLKKFQRRYAAVK